MTKEELEQLFDIKFFDHEVEMFNMLLKAHREGKQPIVLLARGNATTNKALICFEIYRALESGIKVNQVFFDEFVGVNE